MQDNDIITPYLTDSKELDYSKLWADIGNIRGFNAQKNREARYLEVTEAYARYKKDIDSNLSEAREYNSSVDRVIHPKAEITGPPDSPCDWITYEKGSKGSNDYIIKAWGRQVTFLEVAQLVVELYKNEDRIYPPPRFKGGSMLLEFLHECIIEECVSWKILKKYKLVPDF